MPATVRSDDLNAIQESISPAIPSAGVDALERSVTVEPPDPAVETIPTSTSPPAMTVKSDADQGMGWGREATVFFVVVAIVAFFAVLTLSTKTDSRNSQRPDDVGSLGAAVVREEKPRQVTGFTSRVDYRVPQDHFQTVDIVSIRYNGNEELRGCRVLVEVWYEDARTWQADRLWAVWAPGETNRVVFTPRGLSLQYIRLSGTAQAGGKPVEVSAVMELRAQQK